MSHIYKITEIKRQMKKMSRERKKAPFRGLSAVIGQGILDFKHGSTC